MLNINNLFQISIIFLLKSFFFFGLFSLQRMTVVLAQDMPTETLINVYIRVVVVVRALVVKKVIFSTYRNGIITGILI